MSEQYGDYPSSYIFNFPFILLIYASFSVLDIHNLFLFQSQLAQALNRSIDDFESISFISSI